MNSIKIKKEFIIGNVKFIHTKNGIVIIPLEKKDNKINKSVKK